MAELNNVGDVDTEDKKSLRIFSLNDLREYDGTKEHKLIYIALIGDVFDVTAGEKFYGPGKLLIYSFLVRNNQSLLLFFQYK